MSLLLDTHAVLWWLVDDPTLTQEVKRRLDDDPEAYVSAASIWEIAIKQSIGKLSGPADLVEEILRSGFRPLSISPHHAATAGRLPLHHRDPFDRMLVAQAQCEGMTLATRDPIIAKYDVDILTI